MLRRFILYIRHKPKHVRDTYAFGIAGSLTAAIALVWVWQWPSMIEGRQGTPSTAEEGAPLSDFLDRAKDQVAAARGSVDLESLTQEVSDELGTTSTSTAQATVDAARMEALQPATATVPVRIVTTTTTAATTTTTNVQ